MSDRRARQGSGEIRSLTGLRGVAALYVVFYHLLQGTPGAGPAMTFVHHGYLAVDLFFVLSGIVLALVHGRDTFDGAGYRLFLRKRLARIYPLYAAATLAAIAIAMLQQDAVFSAGRLAVNVALMQAWGFGATIVGPAWSLSAECGAYLLFPLLCAVLVWGTRREAALGTCVAAALLLLISLRGPVDRSGPLDLYQSNTIAPLLRCLCDFSLGLIGFRLQHSVAARRLTKAWVPTVLSIAITGLLFIAKSDLLVVALFVPLVLSLAAGRTGFVADVLSSRLVHWLGSISFSIYLVHYLIRDEVEGPLADMLRGAVAPHPTALAVTITLAIVLAVAQTTFHLIERPGRRLVRARWPLVTRAT